MFHFHTGRFHQFWEEAAKSCHVVEALPGNDLSIALLCLVWLLAVINLGTMKSSKV